MTKKMLAGLVLAILSFTATQSFAQGGGGGNRMQMYRQMLKDSVGLNDTQVDSVMAINQEFRPQMRDIRQDQSLSQDDRQAKMKAIEDQEMARYKNFMSDDQISKLQALQAAMRNRMRQGGGGGGGGR